MRSARLHHLFVAVILSISIPALASALELPVRKTPVPVTTNGVPHVQLGVTPDPALSDELLRRVRAHPDLEVRPTIVSLPGALGFWIAEGMPLARKDVIVRGREFAHLHPDGSLHASLSPALAPQAVQNGWAVPHPWANQRPGWEGFVMIYTPQSAAELEIVYQLVLAGFEFVKTGKTKAAAGTVRPAVARPVAPRRDPTQLCSTC